MQTNNIEWPFPNRPPREVQMEALRAGYDKEGFAYFLRQRLGKTWLAYANFTILRDEGKVDWCVIVCPNSLKNQWQEAIEEVDPYTPIVIYNSQRRSKTDYWLKHNKSGGVIIINYEALKAFMEANYWQKFNTLRTIIIGDETTKIKEPSKKMSKYAVQLASICSYKRALTGKPRANSNNDLWAQLKFINATYRNFHQHKCFFSIMGGFRGKQAIQDVNSTILQEEMAPFCYIAPDKYLKGFEKIYEPMRRIVLAGEQKAMYEQMENELVLEIKNGTTQITAPIILTKYLRLQQISSGIAGDIDGVQHNIVDPASNPRIRVVKEILENEVSGKCIIVCRFKLSIKNLEQELTKAGYKCLTMVGGMGAQLDENKRMFNDEDYDILLAQIQVLNYGHTLCGPDTNPCSDVIFYENDFSLINRAQCEARPEKFERDVPISYYDMYASKMDRYIITSLVKKEDASMALMNYSREFGIFGAKKTDDENAE